VRLRTHSLGGEHILWALRSNVREWKAGTKQELTCSGIPLRWLYSPATELAEQEGGALFGDAGAIKLAGPVMSNEEVSCVTGQ
jgi:hypothetical protein